MTVAVSVEGTYELMYALWPVPVVAETTSTSQLVRLLGVRRSLASSVMVVLVTAWAVPSAVAAGTPATEYTFTLCDDADELQTVSAAAGLKALASMALGANVALLMAPVAKAALLMAPGAKVVLAILALAREKFALSVRLRVVEVQTLSAAV